LAPDHELFNTPFKVNLTFEDRETPKQYRAYAEGASLGERIKVWKVQNRSFPKIDPGLVSDPYNFDSVPDAENIASGINSRGPRSVAIGRHGNFLLWGFSAGPSDMTPEAQQVFVNAICYIRKFDHQPPLVRRKGWTKGRGYALLQPRWIKNEPDESFVRTYPAELRERFGRDGEKYRAYYADNLAYLTLEIEDFKLSRAGSSETLDAMAMRFSVDEDAKSLGIPNNDVALLRRCVEMLEQNDRTDLARRILMRYTPEKFTRPADWRQWLDQHHDRLFFSDIGGYRFVIAPRTIPRPMQP
jgi:hypothetical protein